MDFRGLPPPEVRQIVVGSDRDNAPTIGISVTSALSQSLKQAKRWITQELQSCGAVLKRSPRESEDGPEMLALYKVVNGNLDLTKLTALHSNINAMHT